MIDLILQYINYERDILNHSNIYELRYYLLKKLDLFLREKKGSNYTVYDIGLQDILAFITKLRITPITTGNNIGGYIGASTVLNYLNGLRMYFKYLNTIGLKLKFNREQIPVYKYQANKREPMSKEDYEKLRMAPILYADSYLEGLRDQLLIDIPRETGLRRAEIVRIKFEDFHKDGRQFQLLVKGGRYESVFISEHLKNRVLEYERKLKLRFPRIIWTYIFSHLKIRDRGRQFTPERASTITHQYVKILQEKGELDKNITLHQARHSFAMRCVYSGLSQQATMQLMRHKSWQSTLHYYHLNDTWLQEQYDMIK